MPDLKNTRLLYQYRDASNNKAMHEVIFPGKISLKTCERIRKSLPACDDALGLFIPGQIGLRDLQNAFYEKHIAIGEALLDDMEDDPHGMSDLIADMRATKPIWWPDDGPFHELLMIDLVSKKPTDERPIAEIAALLIETDWDEDYLPPFHDEMLRNYQEHMRNQGEPEPE